MSQDVELVITFLHRSKIRATYGAVAEALGTSPRAVGQMLGPKRPETSWIVSKESGLPMGHEPADLAEELESNPTILGSGLELLRPMAGIRGR